MRGLHGTDCPMCILNSPLTVQHDISAASACCYITAAMCTVMSRSLKSLQPHWQDPCSTLCSSTRHLRIVVCFQPPAWCDTATAKCVSIIIPQHDVLYIIQQTPVHAHALAAVSASHLICTGRRNCLFKIPQPPVHCAAIQYSRCRMIGIVDARKKLCTNTVRRKVTPSRVLLKHQVSSQDYRNCMQQIVKDACVCAVYTQRRCHHAEASRPCQLVKHDRFVRKASAPHDN